MKGTADGAEASTALGLKINGKTSAKTSSKIPFVKLDPKHQTSVSQKVIGIPDPAYRIGSLLAARQADYVHEGPDEDDLAIFQLDASKPSNAVQQDFEDYDDYTVPAASAASKGKAPQRPADDWQHNAQWVVSVLEGLMPPPVQSTPSASMAIQRELKSMLKEQDSAPNLKDLGWYMSQDLIGDNLYQWFVEMHSLDPALPIAKDMTAKYNTRFILLYLRTNAIFCLRKLNSIIMEIRFPPTFPNAPPFFRIISPRFLPFIQGGGGHVTGGVISALDQSQMNYIDLDKAVPFVWIF